MPPDPFEFFTAEQIAEITRCPLGSVRDNWPRLVAQMVHCGINDRPTQIAMFATIAIESANTFRPVREAFFLGEPEPAETWRRNNLSYYPYYGRGYIQITHRENYAFYGPRIAELWNTDPNQPDFNLVGAPDRALNADISAAVSALYFRDHGGDGDQLIPNAARAGNWREVRRLVQGGFAKLAELEAMVRAAERIPVTA
jgi:predicted chitinase